MKFPHIFKLSIIGLLSFNSSPASAFTQTLYNAYNYIMGYKKLVCDKDCTQDQVCGNPAIAKQCQSQCASAKDAQGYPLKDGQGFPYNGVCRTPKDYTLHSSITTPIAPAGKHIAEVIDAAEKQCKIRGVQIPSFYSIVAAKFPAKTKEIAYLQAGIREFDKFNGAFEASIHYMWSKDPNDRVAFEKKVVEYNQNCANIVNIFTDIFYWAQNVVPVGGYKSVLPGTSTSAAGDIFNQKVNAYSSR